ncbi:MAG: pyrrolo-quinoline quinone [Verrucomicrobia bacterium]|nr:MAG: pyrrolo-quinoline quinone [Verrucomicrobiota bacterium]
MRTHSGFAHVRYAGERELITIEHRIKSLCRIYLRKKRLDAGASSSQPKFMRKLGLLLPAAALSALCAGHAAESWWPQFRGPNASGVSDSARPPVEFGPGTNQLWEAPVPPGASSPCVWRDRIFLTDFDNGKLETCAFRRSDGKLLWTRVAAAEAIEEYNIQEGSPAASTPATDGRHVVSYFGSCGLVCYDFKGNELWHYKLPVAQTAGSFGSGGSPLIAGGLVVINRDQAQAKDCSLLAVDLKTGTKAWEAARPDVSQSFGTPIFWKNSGGDEIVMSGSFKLKGYDLKTGAERWSLAGMPAFTCTTPVVGDGRLYFAGWAPGKEPGTLPTWESMADQADKNHDGVITEEEAKAAGFGGFFKAFDLNHDGKLTPEDFEMLKAQTAKGENVMVAVNSGAHGELDADKVAWKQTAGLPYVPSPLYYRGRVYLVKDGGMVSSFDAATGAPFYQKERLEAAGSYYASPVAADGRIYFVSLKGGVTVVAAGGDRPKVLHRAALGERVSATPALVGKNLYVRTATALFAFSR